MANEHLVEVSSQYLDELRRYEDVMNRLGGDEEPYCEIEADLTANVSLPDMACPSNFYDEFNRDINSLLVDLLNTCGPPPVLEEDVTLDDFLPFDRSAFRDSLVRMAALATAGVLALDNAATAENPDPDNPVDQVTG